MPTCPSHSLQAGHELQLDEANWPAGRDRISRCSSSYAAKSAGRLCSLLRAWFASKCWKQSAASDPTFDVISVHPIGFRANLFEVGVGSCLSRRSVLKVNARGCCADCEKGASRATRKRTSVKWVRQMVETTRHRARLAHAEDPDFGGHYFKTPP